MGPCCIHLYNDVYILNICTLLCDVMWVCGRTYDLDSKYSRNDAIGPKAGITTTTETVI